MPDATTAILSNAADTVARITNERILTLSVAKERITELANTVVAVNEHALDLQNTVPGTVPTQLVDILSHHAGEHGDSEGVVETLERIIRERDGVSSQNAGAEKVRASLLVVLDQVDYTRGACSVTEMVGAVLPKEVIDLARKTLGQAPADATNQSSDRDRLSAALASANKEAATSGSTLNVTRALFGDGPATPQPTDDADSTSASKDEAAQANAAGTSSANSEPTAQSTPTEEAPAPAPAEAEPSGA
jgi:hypothetical protein